MRVVVTGRGRARWGFTRRQSCGSSADERWDLWKRIQSAAADGGAEEEGRKNSSELMRRAGRVVMNCSRKTEGSRPEGSEWEPQI